MSEFFRKFSSKVSNAVGSPYAFFISIGIVIIWWTTGPIFGYSDTWQLVINTGTTIVTFLMVFLIQNTQNRDSRAIHLKLDELIRSMRSARNKLVNIEDLPDEVLESIHTEFKKLNEKVHTPTAKPSPSALREVMNKVVQLISQPISER